MREINNTLCSQLMATHELGVLLDEELMDDERAELEAAEEVCRRFLSWDLEVAKERTGEGDVKETLREVMSRK